MAISAEATARVYSVDGVKGWGAIAWSGWFVSIGGSSFTSFQSRNIGTAIAWVKDSGFSRNAVGEDVYNLNDTKAVKHHLPHALRLAGGVWFPHAHDIVARRARHHLGGA
jgi:hypothetical protein